MMKFGASLICYAVAVAGAVDCSSMACQKTCQCTKDKCVSEVRGCLGKSSCASMQSCIANCKCGDKACATACATKNPFGAVQAKSLLSCAKQRCASDFADAVTAAIEAPAPASTPVATEVGKETDCSKMQCKKTCQCTKDKCSSEVQGCLGKSSCASMRSCIANCKCGDKACATACAGKNPFGAMQAKPLLACAKSHCASDAADLLDVTADSNSTTMIAV